MDNNELRKLAEAATPGDWFYSPWHIEEDSDAVRVGSTSGWVLCNTSGSADAAYIAAANPKKVLELLDRIAKLEGALIPSESTRAAYMGRFYFNFPTRDFRGNEITLQPNIPWITIREIMAAIMVYASKGAKP